MSRERHKPSERKTGFGRKSKDGEQGSRGEKKSNSYKKNRSFTRNKSLRETNRSEDKNESPRKKENIPFERSYKRKEGGFSPARDVGKRAPFKRKEGGPDHRSAEGKRDKHERPRPDSKQGFKERREFKKGTNFDREETFGSKRVGYGDFEDGKAFSHERPHQDKKRSKKPGPVQKDNPDGLIRLNKYLSNAGIASRREADTLIQSGVVKVNGVVVDQLGYKIKPGDKVTYGDSAVKSERKVYLLLNKPKDYITTLDDPQERKTVMELIKGACRERIYPVGRLDRNTTGLLLFTNDGELTTKLTHPKFGVKKVYHVSLNKGLKPDDFRAIVEGVELEDGPVKADDLAFVGEGKKEIGIEIHSGRNRIVRRLFEHLGYDVIKLDRVVFAGLTKKDLPRGKHRFLSAKEVSFLKMIG